MRGGNNERRFSTRNVFSSETQTLICMRHTIYVFKNKCSRVSKKEENLYFSSFHCVEQFWLIRSAAAAVLPLCFAAVKEGSNESEVVASIIPTMLLLQAILFLDALVMLSSCHLGILSAWQLVSL